VREKRVLTPRHELSVNGGAEQNVAGCVVVRLARNYMTDSASGIGNVAFVAWDNVKVKVEDGLTCCGAFVESDVESVRMETF
jgi:hypothetical protein